jgi:RNase P subunit RPR2
MIDLDLRRVPEGHKPHVCKQCRDIIWPGQTYSHITLDTNKVYVASECGPCVGYTADVSLFVVQSDSEKLETLNKRLEILASVVLRLF